MEQDGWPGSVKITMSESKPIPKEAHEQKQVIQWLRSNNLCHFSVPNEQGRNRSFALANYRRALGCVAGAPDIVIVSLAPLNDRPTAVEMKRIKGSYLTEGQVAFLDKLRQEGWNVVVGKGHSDAISQLTGDLGYAKR